MVHVRTAVMADATRISLLITELGYPTNDEAMRSRLAAILADPDYVTFVADGGDNVVGVAGGSVDWYYEKDGRYSRILVLAVSSSTRVLGVGRRLVDAIERWAASNGAHELFVNSGVHRTDAHRFYEQCGFSRTGFRFVKQLEHGT